MLSFLQQKMVRTESHKVLYEYLSIPFKQMFSIYVKLTLKNKAQIIFFIIIIRITGDF